MASYFIQTWTTNPWQNLAVEKYLSGILHTNEIMLYLWQNERTVVIGKSQNALRECHTELLEADGGYLARRTTGGGAVYHDLGNLCFTFLASPEVYDLEKQLKVVQEACRKFGIQTHFSGRNDILTEDGAKFSGNAFSNTKDCRIQHGTLMIDVDRTMMGRYLTPSQDKMKSKGVRSVQSRVCNLKELNPDITTDAMRQAMRESFEELYGTCEELDPAILDNPVVKGTYDLYASWEWRYGKSPACEVSYTHRFDWGEVELAMTLKHMRIQELTVYSDTLDTELPEKIKEALLLKRLDMEDLDLTADAASCDESQKAAIAEVAEWLKSYSTSSSSM